MERRLIMDSLGIYSLDIEATSGLMRDALDHAMAEELLRCAVNFVAGALIQGGPWPDACMQSICVGMMEMRQALDQKSPARAPARLVRSTPQSRRQFLARRQALAHRRHGHRLRHKE